MHGIRDVEFARARHCRFAKHACQGKRVLVQSIGNKGLEVLALQTCTSSKPEKIFNENSPEVEKHYTE